MKRCSLLVLLLTLVGCTADTMSHSTSGAIDKADSPELACVAPIRTYPSVDPGGYDNWNFYYFAEDSNAVRLVDLSKDATDIDPIYFIANQGGDYLRFRAYWADARGLVLEVNSADRRQQLAGYEVSSTSWRTSPRYWENVWEAWPLGTVLSTQGLFRVPFFVLYEGKEQFLTFETVGCETTPQCVLHSDCSPTEECRDGVCVQQPDTECTPGSCGEGYECHYGQCVEVIDPVPGCAPGSCGEGYECHYGQCVEVDPNPGCTPGSCDEGYECSEEGVCELIQSVSPPPFFSFSLESVVDRCPLAPHFDCFESITLFNQGELIVNHFLQGDPGRTDLVQIHPDDLENVLEILGGPPILRYVTYGWDVESNSYIQPSSEGPRCQLEDNYEEIATFTGVTGPVSPGSRDIGGCGSEQADTIRRVLRSLAYQYVPRFREVSGTVSE